MKVVTSKQRLLTAIQGQVPDRLPVTTHHVMPYFLKKYMHSISTQEFFDCFKLDPILWIGPMCPNIKKGEYNHVLESKQGSQQILICSDLWRIECEDIEGLDYPTIRYHFITPKGTLSTVLQFNEQTSWVTERLIKHKKDIDLIVEFATSPLCDVLAVNKAADEFGERGIVRGNICCFDLFGQPGVWQDAACLYGIQELIMETYDDPSWVHQFLKILHNRKKAFIKSLKGARYDILELGGGDASSTVISPALFDQFVAPYDIELIALAHSVGQRIVYHTCGGMMPILDRLAAMKPDALETFTPRDMGGDADLAKARAKLPQEICMIGGFDQFHFFTNCTPEHTRAEVRRCFEAAGKNGSFILSPSDHFFDADLDLLEAYSGEARKCIYS